MSLQIDSLLSLLKTCIFSRLYHQCFWNTHTEKECSDFMEFPHHRSHQSPHFFFSFGVYKAGTGEWLGETHKQPSFSDGWSKAEAPVELGALVLPPMWCRLRWQGETEAGVRQSTIHELSLPAWNPSLQILSKLQKEEKVEYSEGLRHSRASPLTKLVHRSANIKASCSHFGGPSVFKWRIFLVSPCLQVTYNTGMYNIYPCFG